MYPLSEHRAAIKSLSPWEARLQIAAWLALALLPPMLIFSRGAAEGLGSTIAVLFLLRSHLQRDWAWLKQPPIRIALLLWAYMLFVVTPLAVEPLPSFERAITWIRHPIFFAALAYWLAHDRAALGRVMRFLALILCLVMADTLLQYHTGHSLAGHLMAGTRLTGPFTHLVVGIFLAKMVFPVAGLWLERAYKAENRWQIGLGIGFLLCALIIIMLSNERTALIGFTSGLTLIAAITFTIPKARFAIFFAVAGLAILAGALYTSQPLLVDRIHDSEHILSDFHDSPYGQLWSASIDIWKQHPLFGAGLMGFRSQCLPLQQQGLVHYCDLHSHNVYLEFLSETGLLGLLGFIALIASMAMMMIRARAGLILTAFALAAFMPSFLPFLATQSFFSNWPAWLAWLPLGLAAAMVRSAPDA